MQHRIELCFHRKLAPLIARSRHRLGAQLERGRIVVSANAVDDERDGDRDEQAPCDCQRVAAYRLTLGVVLTGIQASYAR